MTAYLQNRDFFGGNYDGALTFHMSAMDRSVSDVRDEGDVVVIETRDNDPAMVLEHDSKHPDTWLKSLFAKLGNTPDTALVRQAETRFGMSYNDILKTKRTIGAMTTLAFVFDDGTVKIAVVQRTSKGPDGTPNMGALSRFGGGVSGGKCGKGVHGAQHLGNQSVRELMEEFHPYIRSEAGVLTPLDIIPQGYETDGLKGEFMSAVMHSRGLIAQRIDERLKEQGYQIADKQQWTALPLSVPGLTKSIVQIIDGKQITIENVATFDAQKTNRNMDFNTDMLFAVRVKGVRPQDFILKDGETDQRTNQLLDRIIFFGDPRDLERAMNGEVVRLHEQSDMGKAPSFSPAFVPILQSSKRLTKAARALVL